MSQPDAKQPDELLRLAQRLLQPRAIYLRNQSMWCAEDFQPPFHDEDRELVPQYRDSPGLTFTRYSVDTITDPEREIGPSNEQYVSFPHEVGVRLVPSEQVEKQKEGESIEGSAVLFELTATFVAQYRITQSDVEKDEFASALKRFAILNVAYHVWPYWRELLQSSCTRVGIPIIPLPHWRVPTINKVSQEMSGT